MADQHDDQGEQRPSFNQLGHVGESPGNPPGSTDPDPNPTEGTESSGHPYAGHRPPPDKGDELPGETHDHQVLRQPDQ
jgi:hypothetical protein